MTGQEHNRPLSAKRAGARTRRHRRRIPAWTRAPAGVALIVAALFGVLGTLPMLSEIGRPFGGFVAYGFLAHDTVVLGYETPTWWTPIATRVLRNGDEIATVDGRPFTRNAWDAFAEAHAAGRPAVLHVLRSTGDTQLDVPVVTERITLAEVLDLKLSETVVGIVFWLLALLVLRARPRHVTNQVFAVAAAAVAIHRLTVNTSLITDARLLVNLPKVGHMVAAGLIGPLLVHLAYVFPTARPIRPRALVVAFYALGVASGATLALTRLPFWAAVPRPIDQVIDSTAYIGTLVLALVGILALFGRLVWSWRRERTTRRQKRATRIILLGLLGSLPAVVVMLTPLVPGLEHLRTAYWRGLDVRWLMLTIPIAFAYVIIPVSYTHLTLPTSDLV